MLDMAERQSATWLQAMWLRVGGLAPRSVKRARRLAKTRWAGDDQAAADAGGTMPDPSRAYLEEGGGIFKKRMAALEAALFEIISTARRLVSPTSALSMG